MHRSRLAALAIDCPSETALANAGFWRGALTPDPEPLDAFDPDNPYETLGAIGGAEVFIQRIGPAEGGSGEQARLHLDIETDDIEAEVARLEALGAVRVRQIETWWVMQDPAGLRFCVVRPQTEDFPGDAATWP